MEKRGEVEIVAKAIVSNITVAEEHVDSREPEKSLLK